MLSVIPFELFTEATSGVTRVPRVIRIVRLLKLSKVLKMVKIFVRVERHLGTIYRYGLLRIFQVCLLDRVHDTPSFMRIIYDIFTWRRFNRIMAGQTIG